MDIHIGIIYGLILINIVGTIVSIVIAKSNPDSTAALEKRVKRRQLEKLDKEFDSQNMAAMLQQYVQVNTGQAAEADAPDDRTPVGYGKS